MKENKYYELKQNIIGKLDEPIYEGDNNHISFYDLVEYSKDTFSSINEVFNRYINDFTKSINRKSRLNNLTNKKGLLINSVDPMINDSNNPVVVVTFENKEGKFAGVMTIFEDEMSNNVKYKLDYFNQDLLLNPKNKKFVADCFVSFKELLPVLKSFKINNKNVIYKWNEENKDTKAKFKDGIFCASIDLEALDRAYVNLDNLDDIVLATQNYKNQGVLYDYVEFYNKDLMKRFKINVDELNPLFKAIVENHKEESNEMTLKMK